MPNNLVFTFERFSFSVLTGQFSLHRVHIVTQDMSIYIGRICGSLFYWRKIPDYLTKETVNKSRFDMTIHALDITIYNRTWSTDLVLDILKRFENGESTDQITEYFKSLWKPPEPYQLSLIYRAILPFSFHVYSTSITIGNPKLPSYFVFFSEDIQGLYTFSARETPESHLKSSFDISMVNVSFKSHPQLFTPPSCFDTSMREIHERSRKELPILKTSTIDIHMISDMPQCYVQYIDARELAQVTKEPKMSINLIFGIDTIIEYGPYTDKVRRAFMTFFMPFYFNHPVLYPGVRNMIKFMEINMVFPDGLTMHLPFVTNQMQHETLIITVVGDSNLTMLSSQAPATIEECKMTVNGSLNSVIISSSLDINPIIESKALIIDYGMFYPKQWFGTTRMSVALHFEGAKVVLHPYHIDFLTQLGTDWSSWYPFQEVPDTVHNFFPYSYFVTMTMEPVTIVMLSSPTPEFSQILQYNNHPHLLLDFHSFSFKLSSSFIEFQEAQKGMSYSAELFDGQIQFIMPPSHIHKVRRGDDIPDFLTIGRLVLSGSYRWCQDPTGDVQIPMSIKMEKLGGMITLNSFNDLMTALTNYITQERKLPDHFIHVKDMYPPPPVTYTTHSSLILAIDFASIKMPYDLYNSHYCLHMKFNNLLLSMEGYYPLWHNIVSIQSIVVDLPPTDLPYEVFFKQQIGDEDMSDATGSLHINGLSFGLRTIGSQTPERITLSSVISLDIGTISGYTLLPQVLSLYDFVFNATHLWFGDDVRSDSGFNYWWYFMLRQIRMSIGDINVFIDMGHLGLLACLLPSGIMIYADSLIDEICHNGFYIIIPSIDIIHLLQESENEPITPIFRLTTFFDMFRNTKYSGTKEDSQRQSEMLHNYDKSTHMFPYIWGEIPELPDSFYTNPELYNSKAYNSSLNEEFSLERIRASDPLNGGQFLIDVPTLKYKGKNLFPTPEQGIKWLHHFATCRHYLHTFNTITHRQDRVHNLLGTNESILKISSSDSEKERLTHYYFSSHIVIPHTLNINLLLESIPVFAAIIQLSNLKPNHQMLASVIRNRISSFMTQQYCIENVFGVLIPKIIITLVDSSSLLTLDIRSFRYFSESKYTENKNNMTVACESINIYCQVPNAKKPIIVFKAPQFKYFANDTQTVVKFDPISFNIDSDGPDLLRLIIESFIFEISGMPSPLSGKRQSDFESIITNNPGYQREIQRLKTTQTFFENPIVTPTIQSELSALYSTFRAMGLPDFLMDIKNVSPSEGVSINSNSSIIIPKISFHYSHSLGLSFIEIIPYPIVIDVVSGVSSISCGISSLNVKISSAILLFIQSLQGMAFPESNSPPDNSIASLNDSSSQVHFVMNNFKVEYCDAVIKLDHFSTALSSNPNEKAFRRYSLTTNLSGLSITMNKYLSIKVAGISVCQRSEKLEGVLHISPINIDIDFDFILNSSQIIESSFGLNSIPRIQKSNQNDLSTLVPDPNIDSGTSFLDELFSSMSLTILVEPISTSLIIKKNLIASLQFPGCSGLVSSSNSLISFFIYLHEPKINVTNYFSFPITHLLLHGSMNAKERFINIFLMLGQFDASADSTLLSRVTSFINEVISKFGSPEPKESISQDPLPPKNPENPTLPAQKQNNESYTIEFQFLLPQISFTIPEISSSFTIDALFLMVDFNNGLSWEAQIRKIALSVYDSNANLEVFASYLSNNLKFTLEKPSISLTQGLFSSIPKIMQFIDVATSGIKNPDQIQEFITTINQQIYAQVEQGAGQLLEAIGLGDKSNDIEFPTIVSGEYSLEIRDSDLKLSLPHGGEFQISIPNVSLIVQTRSSDKHNKSASSVLFAIQDVCIVLDSAESSTTGASSDAFEGYMRSNSIEEITNDKLSLFRLKLVSLGLIHFQNRVSLESEIKGLKIELYPTFPGSVKRIISVFSPDTTKTNNPEPKKQNKEEPSKSATSNSITTDKIPTEIDASFKCSDISIILNPISNILPIPLIELTGVYKNNFANIQLNIPQSIKISLSPLLINWIKLFQINSTQLSTPEDTSQAQPITESDVPSSFTSEVASSISYSIIIATQAVEVVLGCQPKRSDISAIVGFQSLNIIHSSVSASTNLVLNTFSFHTNNIFAPKSYQSKGSRLFELTIPNIDLSMCQFETQIGIDDIFTSISSDKIEEISLFNDVWVQSFMKSMAPTQSEPNIIISKDVIPSPVVQNPSKIVLSISSFELLFNYAVGSGNLRLTVKPVYIESGPDLSIVLISLIQVLSNGQLNSDITMNDLFIMQASAVKNAATQLMMFNKFSMKMKSLNDPFLDFSMRRTNFFSKVYPKSENKSSVILMSLETPVLKASAQTTSNLISFYHTVTDPITNGVLRAKKSISSTKIEPQQKFTVPPHSKLVILTSGIQMDLFRYYFKDNESLRLTMNSVSMFLAINVDGAKRIIRNLKFSLRPICLSKTMTEEDKTSYSRDILKLPIIIGDLDTIQDGISTRSVKYNFMTDFDGLIEPTLTLGDYEYVVVLIKYIVKQLHFNEVGARKEIQETVKAPYSFSPNKYRFNPGFKVGMGASIKPNVPWLLSQLGISDEHIIPSSLFEGICLGLEQLVMAITKHPDEEN